MHPGVSAQVTQPHKRQPAKYVIIKNTATVVLPHKVLLVLHKYLQVIKIQDNSCNQAMRILAVE